MNRLKLLVTGSLALFLGACGASDEQVNEGKITSEARKVEPYHALTMKVPGNLNVKIGTDGDLNIKAGENILPLLRTQVTDGVLTIDAESRLHSLKELEITAPVKSLDQLNLESAVTSDLKGFKTGTLAITTKGASKVTLVGTLQSFTAAMDGAGELHASDLTCKSASVSIKGAGSADVDASQELTANISGAGSIRYKGDPKITQTIKGVGSISKAE